MKKYFFEEEEKTVKRVPYREYKDNSAMRKVDGTYDKETKSIEVEEITHQFSIWEFNLKGTKFILYVKKEFVKEKEVTSVYVDCNDEKKIMMLERGLSKFEVYNTDLDLKKVEEVTKKDFYKATSKLRKILRDCWLDEERKYVVERF